MMTVAASGGGGGGGSHTSPQLAREVPWPLPGLPVVQNGRVCERDAAPRHGVYVPSQRLLGRDAS